MIIAEAVPLTFDVGQIRGVVFGDLLPVVFEMASDAIAAFLFEIGLLHLFKEGVLVPGSSVEDSGDIGSRAHGAKFFSELVFADILGFVYFEEKMSGVADDVGGILGRKEDGPAVHKADDVALFGDP